jgi:hypothetical protein
MTAGASPVVSGETIMELLAYIDPGAGSLFIQAVIATIVVVPFFLRTQIRRAIDRVGDRPRGGEGTSQIAASVQVDDGEAPAQP